VNSHHLEKDFDYRRAPGYFAIKINNSRGVSQNSGVAEIKIITELAK
jgi:hypothetical protein